MNPPPDVRTAGRNTWTPSPAETYSRPSVSQRMPSGTPGSIVQNTLPPVSVLSSCTSNRRTWCLSRSLSATYRTFWSGEKQMPLGRAKSDATTTGSFAPGSRRKT